MHSCGPCVWFPWIYEAQELKFLLEFALQLSKQLKRSSLSTLNQVPHTPVFHPSMSRKEGYRSPRSTSGKSFEWPERLSNMRPTSGSSLASSRSSSLPRSQRDHRAKLIRRKKLFRPSTRDRWFRLPVQMFVKCWKYRTWNLQMSTSGVSKLLCDFEINYKEFVSWKSVTSMNISASGLLIEIFNMVSLTKNYVLNMVRSESFYIKILLQSVSRI